MQIVVKIETVLYVLIAEMQQIQEAAWVVGRRSRANRGGVTNGGEPCWKGQNRQNMAWNKVWKCWSLPYIHLFAECKSL